MNTTLGSLSAATAITGLSALKVFAVNQAAGKATYEESCKSCQRAGWIGQPGIAKMFKVVRYLGSEDIQAKTDAESKSIITKGTGTMPAVSGVHRRAGGRCRGFPAHVQEVDLATFG